MKRERISNDILQLVSDEIFRKLHKRMVEKGHGTMASSHEILGIVTEEYFELVEAVRMNRLDGVTSELKDIAVACIFGIACIGDGKVDW